MEIKIIIDDKIIGVFKTLINHRKIIAIIIAVMTTTVITYSAVTIPYHFNKGDIISADEMNQNFEAIKTKLEYLEANIQGAPIGTIIAYAGSPDKLPEGWMICDGTSLLKTSYPDLFDKIDIYWGAVDGTHFCLPDLRGLTLRGVDTIRDEDDSMSNRDPDSASRTALRTDLTYHTGNTGNSVGSYQGDSFQGHFHELIAQTSGDDTGNDSNTAFITDNTYNTSGRIMVSPNHAGDIISDGTNGSPNTSSETRPKNAAVYYIIKAY